MDSIIPCIIFFLHAVFAAQGPMFPSCLSPNITWDQSLIIDDIPNITTPEACQQLCQLEKDCVAITWIVETNPTVPNLCALFSATSQDIPCLDCVSGPSQCSCLSQSECEIRNDNIINTLYGVVNVESCHAVCQATSDCTFFTYFTQDHPLQFLCLIFSSCEEVDETCDNCVTGPRDCETCDFSQVVIDGECSGSVCKEGWTEYDGRCYRVFSGENSQIAYRTICNAAGGELASIHSDQENAFITSLLRKNPKAYLTWIGGYDCDSTSSECKWFDGSAFDWSIWAPGQPNGGDCLMMNYDSYGSNLWLDGACEAVYAEGQDCICKM